MELTHSYSSISMFESCPLRYYRQRIKKDVTDPGGTAAHYGTAVHEALEARLAKGTELPTHLTKYESLCKSMERLVTDIGDMRPEYQMGLDRMLRPCAFDSSDVWIRGILDVLIYNGALKPAFVFDWKTGKRRPDSFQLKLCAGFVFRHNPDPKLVKTGFVWLKDMQIDTNDYTREGETEIWKDILTRIKRIEQAVDADTYPARPSGLCRWCPARTDCEFAQV